MSLQHFWDLKGLVNQGNILAVYFISISISISISSGQDPQRQTSQISNFKMTRITMTFKLTHLRIVFEGPLFVIWL